MFSKFSKLLSKSVVLTKKKNYSKTRKVVKTKDGENIYLDFFVKTTDLDNNFENFENIEFISKYD